jgi:hypothetical protein
VISLRRTACLGTCPVYSVEIFQDGFVRYLGIEFVKEKGERRAVISKDKVEKLVAAFVRADYFTLSDDYDGERTPDGRLLRVTDLPTTYTSLRIGAKQKSVRDYEGAPDRLRALEDEIDRVLNTKRWIGSSALNIPAPKLEFGTKPPDP